jgi:tetratricopeptide (TPR) repeat protein
VEGGASASEVERLAPGTLSALIQEIAHREAAGEEPWSEELTAGAKVAGLELVRELGRGGMGVVWEARDGAGRSVAFKAVRPGPSERLRGERLLREAEAAARLSHPNLVTILDAGRSDSGPYLVLELLEGRTLADRLREGPLPLGEALRIGLEVARGLAHAHTEGVVHRDLKPENVLLCDDGRVKVLDLGLAHVFGRRRAEGGTRGYMAPEQAEGAPEDERTDVFALGVLLFEMLTGERPFRREGTFRRAARLEIPGLPAVATAVGRALARAPVDRPRDAGVLVPVLEALRAEAAAQPLAAGAVRVARTRRGPPVVAATAGAALAGLALFLGLRPRVEEGTRAAAAPTVAVADFANETGERELDSLSDLLVTALEESRRVHVIPRSRMVDQLRQLGKDDPRRIDESLAREAARAADARALLVGTVRKFGDGYVVDLRGVDPGRGEHLFVTRERAARKEGLFDLVDRLGAAVRGHLTGEGPGPAPRPVAAVTTQHLEAWEHLARARRAFDRYRMDDARRELEAALELDPEFALARQQLAMASLWVGRGEIHGWLPRYLGGPRGEANARNVAAAVLVADRLPEKERLTLRAAVAWEEDRYVESLRLRDRLAEAFPLDKEATFYAGDVRWHLGETGESIPYFERVLQLDPDHGYSIFHLAWAAASSGRAREYLPWMRGQLARDPSPSVLGLLAMPLFAAGEEAGALEALRRADKLWGLPPDLPAGALYRGLHGQAEEAEAELRSALARPADEFPDDFLFWKFDLGVVLAAQGRLRETAQELGDTRWWRLPRGDALLRLLLAAAPRDGRALALAAVDAERIGVFEDPGLVGEALFALVAGGDMVRAARLAAEVRQAPTFGELPPADRGIVAGLAAWASSDRDTAREELTGVARRSDVYVRYLGLSLLGRCAIAAGDDRAAIAALEEARALPWTPAMNNRVWTYPGLLQALSDAHARSGDLGTARARNEELLRLWRRADPDLPLLADARALAARLAASR